MTISKETLTDIGHEYIRSDETVNTTIDWHDIVAIPQRPKKISKSLYYASHSNGEGGWDNGFNRTGSIPGILRDTKWDIITDDPNISGERIMNVTSINDLVATLYREKVESKKVTIVGVTGSVGKTTTVAFLEHIAKNAGINVVRFYSKRLTPLSVIAHYINRVNDKTELIVMEYSAYLPNHVQALSSMLTPDLAFLMNIYSTHINPNSFKSKPEIFNSKVKIKGEKTHAYLNDEILKDLKVRVPSQWQTFSITPTETENKNLPHTKRTSEMIAVGRLFSNAFNINERAFVKSCNSFKPKEKRIILCETKSGLNIFFHGETSGASRLKSWLETTDNKEAYLFVEELNFADEDPSGFLETLTEIFNHKNSIVLDTPINRDLLKNINANYETRSKFTETLNKLPKDAYVIYHKALATRIEGFDPHAYISNMII